MNLSIPELTSISEKIDMLISGAIPTERSWYNLRQAWELKGGCAYETMRQKRWLQPKGGRVDAYVGGVGVYKRETIVEWLSVTDEMQAAYHAKYQTGAAVPAVRRG